MFASLNNFPNYLNRYLLPYERQTITIRFHPAILFGPSFVVLAGLAGAGAASSYLKSSPDAVAAVWITWGLLLLYLVGRVVRWLNDLFVVTTERLLVVKGILTRDVASVPLARAIGMRLRRSPMGAALGYGHLIFEAGGQDQAIRAVKFIPYPEQLYLEICGMIYPDRSPPPRPGTGTGSSSPAGVRSVLTAASYFGNGLRTERSSLATTYIPRTMAGMNMKSAAQSASSSPYGPDSDQLFAPGGKL